jgi:hypothetical protein
VRRNGKYFALANVELVNLRIKFFVWFVHVVLAFPHGWVLNFSLDRLRQEAHVVQANAEVPPG